MSQIFQSVLRARHFLHFHAVTLKDSSGPELIGNHGVHLPCNYAEQHALTCACTHTKGRAPILKGALLGCLVDPQCPQISLHCTLQFGLSRRKGGVCLSCSSGNLPPPDLLDATPARGLPGVHIPNPVAAGAYPECVVDRVPRIHQHRLRARCQIRTQWLV